MGSSGTGFLFYNKTEKGYKSSENIINFYTFAKLESFNLFLVYTRKKKKW